MTAPILIFDSGVGGLSVVGALRMHLPGAALAYVCDNAALPYGTKPDAWLVARIVTVCRAAVMASGARALVVACNTASTLALHALRECLTVPVIGTVPAIKPAARVSRSGVFGLLATSATVSRPYTQRLIGEFAPQCTVIRLAADPLVAQAERVLSGAPWDDVVIAASLAPLWDAPRLDTVVLGCTHFPLLREALERNAPRAITWIDSGDAIARRVAQLVAPEACASASDASWASAPQQSGLVRVLSGYGFSAPHALSLPDDCSDSV
ncbi:glutamate racemase [Chromohalobacter marismortui]|uniref:Glutamate racemase n=1 Tax=Chromohalobacter marismortui TaxID=42055 RepID=A0A4R7NUN7_9GAMM|nr:MULTISPECIES: glutamate racemase [Chromohalobacter]MCI0510580.1 glutamate racemase [Chromohalobacter sp.]MCI0591895.1 glutamate racemase [Chromohalobacter sp.]TDU24843.1 glutamate racemase [Chromohalobacter marismortui]